MNCECEKILPRPALLFYHRISQKGRFAPTPNTPKQVWKVWKVKQVWKVYFLNLLNLSTFALVQCIQWSKNKTSSPPHFAQCGSAYPLAHRGTRNFLPSSPRKALQHLQIQFSKINKARFTRASINISPAEKAKVYLTGKIHKTICNN